MISLALLAAVIAAGNFTPWFALAAYATKSLIVFVFARMIFYKNHYDQTMFVALGMLIV